MSSVIELPFLTKSSKAGTTALNTLFNEGYLDKLNDELNLENKVGGGLIKKTKDKLAKECLQINETGSSDLETLGSMDNCIIR